MVGTHETVVLVVEPDYDLRGRYRESFQRSGGEVVEASDVRDALAHALTRPPTLVVTETTLPFVEGYALCEILRRDHATTHVPILVVTGDRRDAQWRRALRSGASVVLTKPTTADEVWTDTQRPIDEMADARTRPAERDRPDRPEPHQGAPHRTSRSNTFSRFQTTAPAMPAPAFLSPTCDRPLVCTNSYAGGVTEQQREQWDRYVCPDVCGELDYRHRTRHVRHLA